MVTSTYLLHPTGYLLQSYACRNLGARGCRGFDDVYESVGSLFVVELKLAVAAMQLIACGTGPICGHNCRCLGHERAYNHIVVDFRVRIPWRLSTHEDANRESIVRLKERLEYAYVRISVALTHL